MTKMTMRTMMMMTTMRTYLNKFWEKRNLARGAPQQK